MVAYTLRSCWSTKDPVFLTVECILFGLLAAGRLTSGSGDGSRAEVLATTWNSAKVTCLHEHPRLQPEFSILSSHILYHATPDSQGILRIVQSLTIILRFQGYLNLHLLTAADFGRFSNLDPKRSHRLVLFRVYYTLLGQSSHTTRKMCLFCFATHRLCGTVASSPESSSTSFCPLSYGGTFATPMRLKFPVSFPSRISICSSRHIR